MKTTPGPHEQRLLDALKGGGWKSSPDLYRTTNVMVHSRVASLTGKGYRFERKQIGRTHYYRLKSTPLRGDATTVDDASTTAASPLSGRDHDPGLAAAAPVSAPPDAGSSSERPAALQMSLTFVAPICEEVA